MSALIENLVSPELRRFLTPRERPAASAGAVRLHAGEAPTAPVLDGLAVANLNRVPEKKPAALAARMAEVYGVAPANLAVTADVADAADALIRVFTSTGAPVILAGRGFAAAKRAATLAGARVIDLAPADRFEADLPKDIAEGLEAAGGRGVFFIASPSYEIGQVFGADMFGGLTTFYPDVLFVVDESLIEFSTQGSLVLAAATSDNLVVLRSLSRAYGLAGAPCGALVAAEPVVNLVESALAFRSLPRPTAQLALAALAPLRTPIALARVADVVAERTRLTAALLVSPYVERIFESSANFLAIETKSAAALARRLEQRGILVHWVEGATTGVRLTIGSPAENDLAIEAFGVEGPKRRNRVAEAARETKETRIAVRVDLDGAPKAKVKTGVGYFDHMLEQIAKHGGFDLTLMCEGDTEVDAHHTIEDCMLALGSALKTALGDKRGVTRYGFALPMDEAEAEALIDLSGRPYAVFEGQFAAATLGDYPTEMTAHAFRSLAETMGAAIHIKVRGENDHHKTEACFKAFARALRQAIRIEGDDLPSTKGVL